MVPESASNCSRGVPIVRACALLVCLAAGVASAYDHVGNVTSWSRWPGGLHLQCGDSQAVRIDILSERLLRVRFSDDGSFPDSLLHDPWRLVKANQDYPSPSFAAVERDRAVEIITSALRIHIDKNPLRLSVFDGTEPTTILKGTETLTRHEAKDELLSDRAKKGWSYDRNSRIAWIKPMAGWHYAPDHRGKDDPEKDSVYWVDSKTREDPGFNLDIQLQ
jgi:hypothetical protein